MPTPPAPIAFVDLMAQQKRIRGKVEARFTAILDHGAYINGPEVRELEAALCDFTGASKALAVGNGTDVLIMPMMAMDLGPKDAVFIPALLTTPPVPPRSCRAPRRCSSTCVRRTIAWTPSISNAASAK